MTKRDFLFSVVGVLALLSVASAGQPLPSLGLRYVDSSLPHPKTVGLLVGDSTLHTTSAIAVIRKRQYFVATEIGTNGFQPSPTGLPLFFLSGNCSGQAFLAVHDHDFFRRGVLFGDGIEHAGDPLQKLVFGSMELRHSLGPNEIVSECVSGSFGDPNDSYGPLNTINIAPFQPPFRLAY